MDDWLMFIVNEDCSCTYLLLLYKLTEQVQLSQPCLQVDPSGKRVPFTVQLFAQSHDSTFARRFSIDCSCKQRREKVEKYKCN